MSVKLLILKSGEDVVADVSEMTVSERVVGYYLDCPHKAKLIAEVAKEGTTKHRSRIQMMPWVPLSKERLIPVPSDWVVTIVEPHEELVDMYLKQRKKIDEAETASDDEQSYFTDSD